AVRILHVAPALRALLGVLPATEALQLFCIASPSRSTRWASSTLIAPPWRYRPIGIDSVRLCNDGSLGRNHRRFQEDLWYCSPMACGSNSREYRGSCTWWP